MTNILATIYVLLAIVQAKWIIKGGEKSKNRFAYAVIMVLFLVTAWVLTNHKH